MTQEYRKIWEMQQKMLEDWLQVTQKMFSPSLETGKKQPVESKKMKEKEKEPKPTDWSDAFLKAMREWNRTQEAFISPWRQFYRLPEETDYFRLWSNWMKDSARFWPFMQMKTPPETGNWWIDAYLQWLNQQAEVWKPQKQFFEGMGFQPEWMEKFFFNEAFQKAMKSWATMIPVENWTAMLDSASKGFDEYIAFMDEVDLPFDEIAGFWDRLLVRFTPLDDVPLFRLISDINQYLEVLVNPFSGIAGTPKMLRMIKLWRFIRFYYWSFWLKNAELRGKVLESSLAVWPKAVREVVDEWEENKALPSFSNFHLAYVRNLEDHLEKLLVSDEYSRIQEQTAETGIILKSKMDELLELMISGLPLVTKTEEDNIAQELEALRVKIRELNRDLKAKTKAGATVSELN